MPPEAVQAETTVASIANQPQNKISRPGSRAARDAVTLTADNFDAFVAEKTGKDAPKAEEKPKSEPAKEAKEAPKKDDEAEEIDHPDADKRGKLNERFKELTKARKDAETKAAADSKRAKDAADRAEAAERDRDALRAKYEPPKGDDVGPEPQPEQFADPKEYGKALKEWTADNTRAEDAKKSRAESAAREQTEIAERWKDRETVIRQEVPDYDKRLSESTLKISDQMRDAIVDSEAGPRILLHLADHPDVADALSKLTVGRMLKEIGKLETVLQKGAKADAKEAKAAASQHTATEISRAPAPISPLDGGGDPVVRLTGADPVPTNWSYEDWKAARKAGKIR